VEHVQVGFLGGLYAAFYLSVRDLSSVTSARKFLLPHQVGELALAGAGLRFLSQFRPVHS
jgi:hypothetical protein